MNAKKMKATAANIAQSLRSSGVSVDDFEESLGAAVVEGVKRHGLSDVQHYELRNMVLEMLASDDRLGEVARFVLHVTQYVQ